MSFLTEITARRMAALTRTRFATTVPRASFTTTFSQRKNVIDAGKDALKKVDRAVSDKLVDAIDIGGTSLLCNLPAQVLHPRTSC